MRFLLTAFLILIASISQARILIQAASANSQDFQNFLRLHPEIKSYQDHVLENLQNYPSQEHALFELADLAHEDRIRGIEQIDRLNRERPLTPLSLRFVGDLTEQWIKQSATKDRLPEIQTLHCKARSLQHRKDTALMGCRLETVSTELLKARYPQMDSLIVESFAPFSLGQKLSLVAGAKYHFTLTANSQQPVHFYGTFQQLQEQTLPTKNLLNGTCELPSIQVPDFALMNEGVLYYSKDCQRLSKDLPVASTEGWWQRNKRWVYPTAAIIFAAGLYALKDKTLVIDTSSIK